jgi:glutaredoxin
MKRVVLGVVALMLTGTGTAQTLYRWTDREGLVHYSDQPPPPEVRKVQEKRLRTPSFIETSGPSYAMRRAQEGFPVTLYSTPDCQNECKTARDFLNRRGVPFVEIVLSSPEQEQVFKQQFGEDELSVPSLAVGSQKEKGFAEEVWSKLLDDVGYPRTAIPGSVAKASAPRVTDQQPAQAPVAAAPSPQAPASSLGR